MAQRTTCPACGAGQIDDAFTGRDWALRAAQGTFTYRRCRSCGTAFADPQPTYQILDQAYASSYGNYQGDRSIVERLVEPLAKREATNLARHADTSRPLLEIGCGTGRFLERLRAIGWQGALRGVEQSADVARTSAQRTGLDIRPGTAEDADLGTGVNGTIVLRHVIEHVRDPGSTLERLREALLADGTLYLATPDTRALAARAFGRWWWGFEVPRHLVVFSSPGMRALLRRHEFEVLSESWSFSPQMWNASLYLALDRGRGRNWPHSATHLVNPLVTGPAVVLGVAEVLARRSTMYSVVARPR